MYVASTRQWVLLKLLAALLKSYKNTYNDLMIYFVQLLRNSAECLFQDTNLQL